MMYGWSLNWILYKAIETNRIAQFQDLTGLKPNRIVRLRLNISLFY